MEYTEYYITKDTAVSVQEQLKKVATSALIDDYEKGSAFVPFVLYSERSNFLEGWNWLLKIFDAEGSAWGFTLYASGKQLMNAVYGENAEWGIDLSDNVQEGDLEEAAKVLKVEKDKLETCLNADGVEDFCQSIGFSHKYMFYPHDSDDTGEISLMSKCL